MVAINRLAGYFAMVQVKSENQLRDMSAAQIKRIADAWVASGRSLTDLAHRVGITVNTLYRWRENGFSKYPSGISQLCDLVGCRAEELFSEQPISPRFRSVQPEPVPAVATAAHSSAKPATGIAELHLLLGRVVAKNPDSVTTISQILHDLLHG